MPYVKGEFRSRFEAQIFIGVVMYGLELVSFD